MKKKRPIALLEVLIAMSLVMAFLSYFSKKPYHQYRRKTKEILRSECDFIAAWTFSEIREKFFKNEIRWSQIPPVKQTTNEFKLSPFTLDIPFLRSEEISRKYSLHTLKEKHDQDGNIYRLVEIKIDVNKNIFSYQTILFTNWKQPMQ